MSTAGDYYALWLAGHKHGKQEAADRIEALEAEVAALRKDAERYRFLCASGKFRPSDYGRGGPWGLALAGPDSTKPELDAAIDSAIQQRAG